MRGGVYFVSPMSGSVYVAVVIAVNITYLHAETQQRQFAGVVGETGHRRSDRLFVIISGLLFYN